MLATSVIRSKTSQPFPLQPGVKPALDLLPFGLKKLLVARHVKGGRAFCASATFTPLSSTAWASISALKYSVRRDLEQHNVLVHSTVFSLLTTTDNLSVVERQVSN